jgi:hypothetical protein
MSLFSVDSEKKKVEVKKFYEGEKKYFRQKFSLTLVFLEHHPKAGTTSAIPIEPFIEIIAFDHLEGLEAPHLYLSYDLLVAKLSQQPVDPIVDNIKPKATFKPSFEKETSGFKPSLEKESSITDVKRPLLLTDVSKREVNRRDQLTRTQSSRLILKAGSLHLQDLMIKFIFHRIIVSNNKIPDASGFTVELNKVCYIHVNV